LDQRIQRDYIGDGKVACFLATFTHNGWVCPDTCIDIDLDAAKQKVRNALRKVNYVACFEAGYYVNEKWKKDGKEGQLVSIHCHAVVWGSSSSTLRRLQDRIQVRFTPILGNKNGVRFDKRDAPGDIEASVSYIAKLPNKGYRTVPKAGGGKLQKSAKLTLEARFRLLQAMRKYCLDDLWLASGEGAEILKDARASIQARRRRSRPREVREIEIPSSLRGLSLFRVAA
jgi:hypothetical protein